MIAMKIMIVEDEENIRDGIRNLGMTGIRRGLKNPCCFPVLWRRLCF